MSIRQLKPRFIQKTSTQRLRQATIVSMCLILLGTLLLPILGREPVKAETLTTTLTPIADTYIQNSNNSSNFGTSLTLTGTTSDTRGLMRWNTAGQIPTGATLKGVKMRLFVTNISTGGGALIHPAGDTWVENTVTWINQPTWNTSVITTSSPAITGTWLEISLPISSIDTSGNTNFGVRHNTSGSNFRWNSRESTNKPQLLLTYETAEPQPPVSSTLTFNTSADTFVRGSANTANYGTSQELSASSSDARAYLKWATANSLPAGTYVKSMSLRVYTTNIAVTSGGFEVHPTTDTWEEGVVTWISQPTWNNTVLATSQPLVTSQWTDIPLPTTSFSNTGNTNVALRHTVSGSMARFASKEYGTGNYAAQLIVTVESAQPQPPTDPVLVAAGDIACPPGATPTATTCQHAATSDVAISLSPTLVAILGDAQYHTGTLSEFMGGYDPTWGRLKSITRPVSGNHEYQTPGAQGFFDYFNGVGQFTGPAGDRDKGYYSYDIDSWHVVVLNSECYYLTGCGEGSPQYNWLKQDLESNTAQCTLAYWHKPRFSSSNEYNNDTTMSAFWNLMVGDVDVALTGHNHAAEIYKKIGVTPTNSSTPVLSSTGIKQFVVGTGGRSQYAFTKPPTVASTGENAMEARDDDTFGVMRMVLKPTGYDWSMVAIPGSNFHNADSQTSGAFQGSETCN